jgi:hypothetical protein
MKTLEAWISEEGVLTGAQQVAHIEYDCNWTGAFRVVLCEFRDGKEQEFIGEGPSVEGGLKIAVDSAIAKARA